MSRRRIFISYRRNEASGSSRLIYERLRQLQPEWELFMDVQDIAPGDDWRSRLAERIAWADTVLVLIGNDWLTMQNQSGERRLDDPNDVTRWEVTEALARSQTRVIPVLLNSTDHLVNESLPQPLQPLADKQAIEIRHASFDSDLENLIARLQRKSLRERLQSTQALLSLESTRRWLTPILAVVVFCLFWIGLLDILALDTRASIWSFALSEMVNPSELDDDIRLVAIPGSFDTTSHKARESYARLVERLSDAGAKAVLFDLYFEDPKAVDGTLVEAMTQAKERGTHVYFGFRALKGEIPQAIPALAEAATGVGLICAGGRLDYTQVMPIAFNFREKAKEPSSISISPLPGLALLGSHGPISVRSLNPSALTLDLESPSAPIRSAISLLDEIREPHPACQPLELGTRAALIFLRLSPLETLRNSNRKLAMEQAMGNTSIAELVRDRIVIIGHESAAERKRVAYRLSPQIRFGYELYADAISTLRQQRVAQPIGMLPQFLTILVSATLGGWLGVRLLKQPSALRWGSLTLLVLLYLLAASWMIADLNLIPNITYDLFALISAYLVFRRSARHKLSLS